jgi:hypothetical protein
MERIIVVGQKAQYIKLISLKSIFKSVSIPNAVDFDTTVLRK